MEINPNRGRWINPLLPVLAVMLIAAGLTGVSVYFSHHGDETIMKADIQSQEQEEKTCDLSESKQYKGCLMEDDALGVQYRICGVEKTWGEWSMCSFSFTDE